MNTIEKIQKWVVSQNPERPVWFLRTDPFPAGHLFAMSVMIDGILVKVHSLSFGVDIYTPFKRTNIDTYVKENGLKSIVGKMVQCPSGFFGVVDKEEHIVSNDGRTLHKVYVKNMAGNYYIFGGNVEILEDTI